MPSPAFSTGSVPEMQRGTLLILHQGALVFTRARGKGDVWTLIAACVWANSSGFFSVTEARCCNDSPERPLRAFPIRVHNKQVPALWTPTKPPGHLCTTAKGAKISLHTMGTGTQAACTRPERHIPPSYRKPLSSSVLSQRS